MNVSHKIYDKYKRNFPRRYIHTRWYGNVLIDDGTSRKEYLISNFEFVTGLVDGDLTQSTLVAG